MKDWNLAVNKFLEQWKNKKEFEGAILSGSYAVGYQSEDSDIDVMIILSDKTPFWERGNIEIDSFLIEYIADPFSIWKKSFEDDFNSGKKVSVNMLAIGKILIDKSGLVKKLKNEADSIMDKPFNKMSEREIEMAKYHLSDGLSKLKILEKDGFSNYAPLYYLQMSKILNYYARFTGISIPATAKIHKFLNDSKFRDKYKLKGFEDNEFINFVNKSLSNYNSINNIKDLTQYVLKQFGGFEIKGWVLKTAINNE